MATSLVINGREYTPAGVAGKHLGFTRDYMLMLARDGRIDGKKIGHRWYIHLPSAEQYFSDAEVLREERKRAISEERKAELKSHMRARTPVRHLGLLEVGAIVAIFLLVGTTGYLGTTLNTAAAIKGDASFFERLAISLFEFISPADTAVTTAIPVVSVSEPSMTETPTVTTHTALVIAPDQVLTTTTVESIRESFSDDVSVSIDPEHPDTGIIIPHFKDADGEAYRYLMVPVNTEGG